MQWFICLYRRLRNLDALNAAQRHQRIAVQMAMQAQSELRAVAEQLAACRAVLAITMRQRDDYEAAIEVLARKLAHLKEEQRRQRLNSRYWITRTIRPQKVSEN